PKRPRAKAVKDKQELNQERGTAYHFDVGRGEPARWQRAKNATDGEHKTGDDRHRHSADGHNHGEKRCTAKESSSGSVDINTRPELCLAALVSHEGLIFAI